MPDLDQRLSAIFRAALPDGKEQPVELATRDTTAGWDSIAAMTLTTLIEEEFGEVFELEEAAEWTSYQQIRAVLKERLGA